jgi:hypothetical protein
VTVEMSVKRLLVHPRIRCGGAQIGLLRQIGNLYPGMAQCDPRPRRKHNFLACIRIVISPAFVLFAVLPGEPLVPLSGDMNNRGAIHATWLGGRSRFRFALCSAAAGRREPTRIGGASVLGCIAGSQSFLIQPASNKTASFANTPSSPAPDGLGSGSFNNRVAACARAMSFRLSASAIAASACIFEETSIGALYSVVSTRAISALGRGSHSSRWFFVNNARFATRSPSVSHSTPPARSRKIRSSWDMRGQALQRWRSL